MLPNPHFNPLPLLILVHTKLFQFTFVEKSMFLWVQLPPESFTKICRVVADALEIIEVFGGNVFKNFAHSSHSEFI